MIVRLANRITDRFVRENLISRELRGHYVYALITMIERAIAITSIIMLGFVLREPVSTVIFLLVFFSLRRHTGGFHAKYFWQCYLESLTTYICVLYLSAVLTGYLGMIYVCLILAVIYILKTGTVNHPNMAMDHSELAESKKAARRMVLFQSALILALGAASFNKRYIAVMSMAVILCAALMIMAKLKKQEVSCDETV